MAIKLGVLMDPIGSIHYKKDSTLAMLWEAQARGWEIYYFEPTDLIIRNGIAFGDARLLQVHHDASAWFTLSDKKGIALAELDVILMRKDPPFNEEYINLTYILETAEREGVLVVNRPQSLRDCNEKFFATFFPQCSPPLVVTSSLQTLQMFLQEQQDIVCKPLDGMAGTQVFRLKTDDTNAKVIFEILTHNESRHIMAQRYIPEIVKGDKRILLVGGQPIPHALARVPQPQDWRGNLAVGAKPQVQPLSERDQWICQQVGPVLIEKGLYFVGIDVIGDFLTEVNVTSPTGIREVAAATGFDASKALMDLIEKHIV